MENLNGHRPAFPLARPIDETMPNVGISKREYFAAMAMQAILSSFDDKYDEKSVAKNSIKMADELLKALSNE